MFSRLDLKDKGYTIKIIKEIPLSLLELYNYIITRIEKGRIKDPEYCKNILVATLLAYRPLSFSELAVLASLLPKIIETIIKKCDLFLTTKEKTVYLIY